MSSNLWGELDYPTLSMKDGDWGILTIEDDEMIHIQFGGERLA